MSLYSKGGRPFHVNRTASASVEGIKIEGGSTNHLTFKNTGSKSIVLTLTDRNDANLGIGFTIATTEQKEFPAEIGSFFTRSVSTTTLSTGTNGVTSIPGTRTLTSAGANFVGDGVVPGDILQINDGTGDDGYYTIKAVAATVLTVDRDWPVGSIPNLNFTAWDAESSTYEATAFISRS